MSAAPARGTLTPMDALTPADPFVITSADQLAALYDPPAERVRKKVIHALEPKSRAFIAASPYCVLATSGPRGAHATPRGDAPGFVVPDGDHALLLPDRRGNNRIDALRDLLDDPRIGLLFLIPGVPETLRVTGTARITTDPALRARFTVGGSEPATVLRIAIGEIFMHCGRAMFRSHLWPAPARPQGVPTAGEMLEAHTGGLVEAASYDATTYAKAMTTLY